MTNRAVRLWYAVLVAFISAIVIAGVSIQYSNHTAQELRREQSENDRRWCALLDNIGDAYRDNPPTTPAGLRQANEVDKLRTEFGCQ